MQDIQITLTQTEKEYLVNLLDTVLGDTRVEARHTRTSEYREKVHEQEKLVRGLLDKLQ